jgi:sec-independent protein translocase protein TatA
MMMTFPFTLVPLMPTLGVPELLLILALVLILFGVGKLPDVLRSMGQGVKAFRDASTSDGAAKPSRRQPPKSSTSPPR